MATPDIYQRMMIDVLTPNVKSAVLKQYIADTFAMAGCTHENGYENEFLAHYPMERHVERRGTRKPPSPQDAKDRLSRSH